ncbi:hypothetical protein OQA88_304 [Cercophora sp. LCS_1]
MAPPIAQIPLDIAAISGICGSISIACWVVVFSPQIIENFRRSSADGLSIQFIIVWLLGDVFNILGAVMQGVLPTMVILAIYYTIADVVLLAQCFYYRGFTLSDEPVKPARQSREGAGVDERTALIDDREREREREREGHRHGSEDWTHLSPAVPMVVDEPPPPPTKTQVVVLNGLAIVMVCAAGVAGWWLSREYGAGSSDKQRESLEMDFWGQVFGWLCAVLYLGSRLPQLLLNWRRKSTEGVSMLFFMFACLGNLTYVLSILAFEPECDGDPCREGEAAAVYWRYILVNLSWLAGSAGTLGLDFAIFAQFFLYSKGDEEDSESEGSASGDEESVDDRVHDQRPLLQGNQSGFV